MASISVSEADFNAVSSAAMDAELRGEREQADALDRVARKINAALASSRGRSFMFGGSPPGKGIGWQDVPSVLEGIRRSPSPSTPTPREPREEGHR